MASNDPRLTKSNRLSVFYSRLGEAASAGNHDEGLALITKILHAVEDEFSGVAYNPEELGTDGRMYPPNVRFRYKDWERPNVCCYRQVAHATFIADNGAIEIRARLGADLGSILFEKPGQDGKKVSDYDSSQ